MAFIPASDSVVTFQSDPTKLLTHSSVSGVVTLAPTSVATLQGTNPWTVTGNSSVQVVGAVPTTSVVVVPGVGVLGSVATLQGTNPWFVQLTSGSVITTGGNSSVQVNNIVTGQSSVYLIPGVGVLGSIATLQGTNPWLVQTI